MPLWLAVLLLLLALLGVFLSRRFLSIYIIPLVHGFFG